MPELGKATYILEIDTRKFDKDLKRARVKIESATDDTEQGLKDVEKQSGKTAKQMARDQDRMASSISATGKKMGELTTGTRENERAVSSHTRTLGKSDKAWSKTKANIVTTNAALGLLSKTVKLVKWPAIFAGAGMAVRWLAALTGGATALIGALGPLTGALASAASAYSALAQAFLVFKIADIKNLTAALSGNETALKKLTPAARSFMQQIQKLKPQWDALKKAVQAQLFPGLEKGLQAASKNMGVFQKVMAATAGVIGKAATRFGQFLGSKSFGQDFAKIGKTNNYVLGQFSKTAIQLVSALRHVMIAAAPLTKWLAHSILLWAQATNQQAKSGRETGRLATFFQHTKETIQAVVGVLGPLWGGLKQIFSLGRGPGMILWKEMGDAAQHFENWTKSAQGANAIKQYFMDILPTLRETGRLLHDITTGFFQVGQGQDMAPMIKQLRTELLPALIQFLSSSSKRLGPAFITMLTQITILFTTLGGANGPLILTLDTVNLLLKSLNAILSLPFVSSIVSWTITLASLAGLLSKIGALMTGITKLKIVEWGGALMKAMAPNLVRQIGLAWMFMKNAILQSRVAMWLMNNTFKATVIGLILTGIVLLITHWKQVKPIIMDVVNWVRANLGPVFMRALNIIKTGFFAVKGVLMDVIGVLKTVFAPVWAVLKWVATAYFNYMKFWFTVFWNIIKMVGGILWKYLGGPAFNKISAVVKFAFGIVKTVITTAFNVIKAVATPVIKWLIGAWGTIKNAAGDAWGWIKDKAIDAWGIMKDIASKIGGVFSDAFSTVKNVFNDVVNALTDFINVIIRGINALPSPPFPDLHEIGKSTGAANFHGANQNPGAGRKPGGGMTQKGQGYAVGGRVDQPSAIVGEEAPRHPEYVLATNPKYRSRNLGLWAQAGQALGVPGFFGGGVWDTVKGAAGGAAASMLPGGAALKQLFGSGGPLSKLNLPSLSDLPNWGWLQDIGKWMLDQTIGWAAKKGKGLLDSVFGGGGTEGPKGVGTYMGVPMANWVIEALRYAAAHGSGNPRPTSGYRPGFDPHTATGTSEHQGTQYPHGAVDFGGYTTGGAQKMAVVNATRGFKWPLLAPIGFHDEGHASGTGHYKGGILHFAKGGKRVGASTYGGPGDPSSGTHGYRGDDLRGKMAYAELAMGHALGGLPYKHKLRISHGGKSVIGQKLDIGKGGGPAGGLPRKIDLWYQTARALGLPDSWLGAVNIAEVGGVGGGSPKTGKGTGTQEAKKIRWPAGYAKTQKKVVSLTDLADKYAEFATRANTIEGSIFGGDETSWLTKELDALFQLRNVLIHAYNILNAAIRQIDKAQKGKGGLPGGLLGFAKGGKKKGKGKSKGKGKGGGFADAATTRQAYVDAVTGITDTLKDIQGPYSPMSLLASMPPLGVLGGRILDVQSSLKDAGGDTSGITSTGGFSTTRLKEIMYLSGLGVHFQAGQFADLPFAGSYLGGGTVPGPSGTPYSAIVHGGETVLPESGSGGTVLYADIYIGNEKVEEMVRVQLREKDKKLALTNLAGVR